MGAGSSHFGTKGASICLDEDVFGKISNSLPNTAVPIEIKPKKRLNGGRKRVSLRGDSINKSSSFFSNISSNKNGSLGSFLSLNKSEYKRQNEMLKHELKDLKNKMNSQIQILLSSNVTLKHQNVKLKSEIDEIKTSKKRIHKELLSALDNQLELKENVQIYEHKVSELQNVITIHSKDHVNPSKSSKYGTFSNIINNQITMTFIEFMISSMMPQSFKLNRFCDVEIKKHRVLLFVCDHMECNIVNKILNEMISLFSLVVSNFIFSDVVHVTNSLQCVRDNHGTCDCVVVVDGANCNCCIAIKLGLKKPIHHLRYNTISKKPRPPIEESSPLLITYNIFERSVLLDVQTFVLNFLQCDSSTMLPLVFDYSTFFSIRKQVVLMQSVSQKNTMEKSRSMSELEFYLQHMKRSLFISCSTEDSLLLLSHLYRKLGDELVVCCEVDNFTTYPDISQTILVSLFYQIGMDMKYVNISDRSLFDIIDYLSLFFEIIIVFIIGSSTLTRALEDFMIIQKNSQCKCIILGSSISVQIIQSCDSVFLSETHTPALSVGAKPDSIASIVSSASIDITEHTSVLIKLLTVFCSGLSDCCIKNLLNCDIWFYLQLKIELIRLGIITFETGLVTLVPNFYSLQSSLPKKVIADCLEHILHCRCYHLHLNDMNRFLVLSKSPDVANAIIKNPEALAYNVYHHTSSVLMKALKISTLSVGNLPKTLVSVYGNRIFSETERILIYRIISQLYYAENASFESLLFIKMAEDLEAYTNCEPCLQSCVDKVKLSTEYIKLCNAELQLHESYCKTVRTKLLTESVQLLLVHSGILKSMDKSDISKKYFDRACSLYRHSTELTEVDQVLGYCTLLKLINRSDVIDTVFQNLISKLNSATSRHIICMVLVAYASYHMSEGRIMCAVSLLEYLAKSDGILIEPYADKVYRMLGILYLRLKNASEAIDAYKKLLGKEIEFSKLTNKIMLEDIYNYTIALIMKRYFGSAYDIIKSVRDHLPDSIDDKTYRTKISKLMVFLRSIISKCKPNSGHYRVALFL